MIAALGQANVGKIVIGCINYDRVVPVKTSTLSEEEQLQAYPEVFRKGRHFTGENELRAFIPPEELCVGDAKLGPEYKGKLARVALPDLLCEVWVAPTAPYWLKPVVEAELSKYGYGAGAQYVEPDHDSLTESASAVDSGPTPRRAVVTAAASGPDRALP